MGNSNSYFAMRQGFYQIIVKYFDYTDIFTTDLAIELIKKTSMNKYTIKLIEEK